MCDLLWKNNSECGYGMLKHDRGILIRQMFYKKIVNAYHAAIKLLLQVVRLQLSYLDSFAHQKSALVLLKCQGLLHARGMKERTLGTVRHGVLYHFES